MSRLGERLRRPARIIGAAAALAVTAFMFVWVVQAEGSDAVTIGVAFLAAAAVVLLAPRAFSAGVAIVTALGSGLLAILAAAMGDPSDPIILGAAGIAEAWAAWDLVRHPDPSGPPPREIQ